MAMKPLTKMIESLAVNNTESSIVSEGVKGRAVAVPPRAEVSSAILSLDERMFCVIVAIRAGISIFEKSSSKAKLSSFLV